MSVEKMEKVIDEAEAANAQIDDSIQGAKESKPSVSAVTYIYVSASLSLSL